MFNQAPAVDTYFPETQNRSKTALGILILTADKVEDLEFFYPYYRFIEAGYRVDVATPKGGSFKGKQGLGLENSQKIIDIDPKTYDLLYLPGGKAPAALKDNEDALMLIKVFAQTGRPIAAVCHGPLLLAAADLIKGRHIAAWPEVKKDLEEAGAIYENKETFCDGQFITARWPADLPSHLKYTLRALAEATKGLGRDIPDAAE